MLSREVTYLQQVRIDGYRWESIKHPRSGRLVQGLLGNVDLVQAGEETYWEDYFDALNAAWKGEPNLDAGQRTIDISKSPDLYRQLAQLSPNRDSILAFANKYGFIGVTETIVVDEGVSDDGLKWSERVAVEFTGDWLREITIMSTAVQVLNALDDTFGPNTESLAAWFYHHHGSWHASSQILHGYIGQGRAPWIDLGIWADDDACVLNSIEPNEVERAATEFLRILANKQMKGRVSAYSVWDDVETKTTLTFKPDSLLGAMWLQFARALTKTENMRVCIECGKLFEFVRKSRMFCSEACQKRYSRRKARQVSNQ